MTKTHSISVNINGKTYTRDVEARMTLADFLRHEIGLTGTHLGCEHGVCGACTVLLDGAAVRSCLIFAVQAQGSSVRTIEGVAARDGTFHPLQEGMRDCHSFQCGFCTPGFVMSALGFLADNPDPTDDEMREALSGGLCRCTGYASILAGVKLGAAKMRDAPA